MATKGSGLVYLHKDGFQLYSPLFTAMFEFHFVPEIVHDLDVINEDLLKELITLFINSNKIPPLTLTFVLADNACFIKDFVSPTITTPNTTQPQPTPAVTDSTDVETQVDQFIEHVPFDTVASKTFPLPHGTRALATNQDLYDAIKAAFMQQDFVVDAILPALPFGESISARPAIDIPTAVMLMQKANSLKIYNLTTHAPLRQTKEKSEVREDEPEMKISDTAPVGGDESAKAKERKRLIILVSVFLVLVILLVIVYINSQTPPPPAPAV